MEKELIFLSAQPNDLLFIWQVDVQLHNFKKLGILDKYDFHICVWNNHQRKDGVMFAKEWTDLQIKYKDTRAKFFFYKDETGDLVRSILKYGYPSLVRPWMLHKHFRAYPELKEKALFYTDQDVIFTKFPDFLDRLKDDEICYLSDTRSYIAASYFDSKVKDVKEEAKEAYKEIDPLQIAMESIGLNRDIADKNELGSGGAQYLLKNIDASFWQEAFLSCIKIKLALNSVNRRFFESENKGFQSWCADMWAVLWGLWKRGQETACPKEMDFAWATDVIEKLETVYIFHNAGVTPESVKHKDKFHKLFYKGKQEYADNVKTPFEDNHDYVSYSFASKFYVEQIEEIKASLPRAQLFTII